MCIPFWWRDVWIPAALVAAWTRSLPPCIALFSTFRLNKVYAALLSQSPLVSFLLGYSLKMSRGKCNALLLKMVDGYCPHWTSFLPWVLEMDIGDDIVNWLRARVMCIVRNVLQVFPYAPSNLHLKDEQVLILSLLPMQTFELLDCMVLRQVPNWLKFWCCITVLSIFFFPSLHEHLTNPQSTESKKSQRDKLSSIASFQWHILVPIFSSLLRTYHSLLLRGQSLSPGPVVLFRVRFHSCVVSYIFLCQMDTIVFDGYYSNLNSARIQKAFVSLLGRLSKNPLCFML